MTRVVVCATGPLLLFSEADAIQLLQQAGEISIPVLVAAEFEQKAQERKPPAWVRIQELDDLIRQRSVAWVSARHMDASEAVAIALALQLHADWLLSDDVMARQFADALGLEVHGSIGLLLWSVAAGHIDDRQQALVLLDALSNSSLWVSRRVLREAHQVINKLISK